LYEFLQKLHFKKQKNFSIKGVNFSGNDPTLYVKETKQMLKKPLDGRVCFSVQRFYIFLQFLRLFYGFNGFFALIMTLSDGIF